MLKLLVFRYRLPARNKMTCACLLLLLACKLTAAARLSRTKVQPVGGPQQGYGSAQCSGYGFRKIIIASGGMRTGIMRPCIGQGLERGGSMRRRKLVFRNRSLSS